MMLKRNPVCGCGEEKICNEAELECDPCCRCIPLRLCAVFSAYGCDCDGATDLLELDTNSEYIGEIGCGGESLDLLVFIEYEYETCYWRVISENFDLDLYFEIGPGLQSCESPVLEFEVPFEECTGTIAITRYDLELLPPRTGDYCEEEPWCGSCECVCKRICVTRRFNGEFTHEELEWDDYSRCWEDICLIRDEYTGGCLVVADGFDPVPVNECGLGFSFQLTDGENYISGYCKECACRVCNGCCFPWDVSYEGIPFLKDLEWEISAPNCPDLDGATGTLTPVDPQFRPEGNCGFCSTYQNTEPSPDITGQIPGLPGPDPYECLFSPCDGHLCLELCCELESATDSGYDDCCSRLKLVISSNTYQFSGGRPRLVDCVGRDELQHCEGGQLVELSPSSCVCDPETGLSVIFDLASLGFSCDEVVHSGPCEGEPDCCVPTDCTFADATLSISVK